MTIPRYLARRAAQYDADPRMLFVCPEKHGTHYYRPADFGGYLAMCLAIFQRRDDDNHVYYPRVEPGVPVEPPAPTALVLADEGIKRFHSARVAEYHAALRTYTGEMDTWKLCVDARAGSAVSAAILLDIRHGCEYEGFHTETLSQPAPSGEAVDAATRARAARVRCASCHALVNPTADGACPRCTGQKFSAAESP